MQYLDRDGRRVTAAVWGELYRDFGYGRVAHDAVGANGSVRVETDWVGVWLSCERVPRPYVTRIITPPKGNGNGPPKTVRDVWSEDEAAALRAHAAALAECREAMAGGRRLS